MAKIIDQAMEDGVLPSYRVYTISQLAREITGYFNGCKRFFTKAIQEQKKPFGSGM